MKYKILIKTITLIFITTLLLVIRSNALIIILFALTIGLLIRLGNKGLLQRRIIPLIYTTLFLVLFHVIWNVVLPYDKRIIAGILSALRLFTLSSLVLLYTTTTSAVEILSILSFLPDVARLLFTITLSAIPSIFEEHEHIYQVQQTRGLRVSRAKPLSHIFPVILPLFHSIFRRSEQLTIVLTARGYSYNG